MNLPHLKCPACGMAMAPEGFTFVERGTWTGKEYTQEGEHPTFVCTDPGCDTEIVVMNRTVSDPHCSQHESTEEDCAGCQTAIYEATR